MRFARHLTLLAFALLLVLTGTFAAQAERRVALVIGNDAYQELPILRKAVADAASFAAVLSEKNFDEVILEQDVTRQQMDMAIARFIAAIEPGDTAVFIYSGHGWSDGAQNFLVGIDAPKSGAPEFLARISIPVQNGANGIVDEIGKKGAGLKVAIIDACRDNPFAPTVAGRSVGLSRGLTRVEPPSGTFVIFSAGANQTALDALSESDGDPNSVFTRTFLPLVQADLSLLDAIKAAQEQVFALARTVDHEQRPAYYDEVLGNACLTGACTPAEGQLSQPQPPPATDREAIFWSSIQNSSNAADFEAYLAQFPDGTFASLARIRLAALQPVEEMPPAPASAGPIHFGVAGPMTGPNEIFGAQIKAGAEQAVEDINEAGGLLGRNVVLDVGDDMCDPKEATGIANKLSEAGIVMVAGHFCSGSSIPASYVYAEHNVIQISPASTNPRYTDERPGPGVFRVSGRDDQQGEVAGRYLASNFANKRIAIVHDSSPYGQGLAEAVKRALNAAGKREVIYSTFTPGESQWGIVRELSEAKAEVVYVGGFHTDAANIRLGLADAAMDTILIAGDALVTDEYWTLTRGYGEGTLMTFAPDPRTLLKDPSVLQRFEEDGVDPSGYTLYAYLAVQVWAEAAKRAGSVDFERVVAEINEGEVPSVFGTISFDEKGDVLRMPTYVLYRWHDGSYEQL